MTEITDFAIYFSNLDYDAQSTIPDDHRDRLLQGADCDGWHLANKHAQLRDDYSGWPCRFMQAP